MYAAAEAATVEQENITPLQPLYRIQSYQINEHYY